MRIPRPFARVVVEFGAPLALPPELDEALLECWRVRLEEKLCALGDQLSLRASASAGAGERS